MIKKKMRIISTLFLAGSLLLAACSQLDVIGKDSVTTFDKLLAATTLYLSEDASTGEWAINAPDGDARFVWGGESGAFLEFNARPFYVAGLDPEKLPETFQESAGKLKTGTRIGAQTTRGQGTATALSSFEQLVSVSRERFSYHAELDHYGIDLGNGNMFEWAKDLSTNDKDIVFVLNPQPFLDAGVDPDSVEGWVFAKVKIMDAQGKTIEVDKFLKPFDLE